VTEFTTALSLITVLTDAAGVEF